MKEILEGAANTLEALADKFESGIWNWTQGFSRDRNRCVLTGLCEVTRNMEYYEQRVHVITAGGRLADALNIAYDDGYGIIRWNDTEGRTRDEVIEALKGAAKDLRNQGGDK